MANKFRIVQKQKSIAEKPIDIRKVFREKNPNLAKIMPDFVFRYIDRILQTDFLNYIFTEYGHLTGIEFVDEAVKEFNIREQIHGYENIPNTGRFIFASNHPLGGFDALVLMKLVHKKLGKLKFITNDVLMAIPNLSPMFIPVNKHGSNSRDAARVLNETYDSDEQILIFPSGMASRKIKGNIVDLEWKKHFITKAIKHKRDIIPVFVEGRNSNRFYRIANWRKFLHIGWNLEMFFLPDETIKHRNKTVPIYFGKPISYNTFDSSKNHKEWAERVKTRVYQLPDTFKTENFKRVDETRKH